jgi:hypothetical protein
MASLIKTDITDGFQYEFTSIYNDIAVNTLFGFIFILDTETNQFRYKFGDGVYSSWFEVNETNIRNIQNNEGDITIQYQYVNSLSEDYFKNQVPFFSNSIFGRFKIFNDEEIILWSLNVMEKLYEKGILAWYLDRNGEGGLFKDEDFLSFWNTLVHNFAMMVSYARIFKDITQDDSLMIEFLNQFKIYLSNQQTTDELIYLVDNYIDEFNARGTERIYNKKEDGFPVDGELLRLLSYQPTDEFIFALTSQDQTGWNLGTSSPMYNGTDKIPNLTKAYEKSKEVIDINKYPIFESGDGSIIVNSGYFEIDGTNGVAGINPTNDLNKKVIVDPKLDYEISFRVTFGAEEEGEFLFGIISKDINGNVVDNSSAISGSTENNFTSSYEPLLTNVEYWVRGVLYNSSKSPSSSEILNIGDGNNLIMNSNTSTIDLNLLFTFSGASGSFLVRDVKIRPLNLPFSLGMLGTKNLIINFIENNSGKTKEYIESQIERYLIPYNSTYKPVYIE